MTLWRITSLRDWADKSAYSRAERWSFLLLLAICAGMGISIAQAIIALVDAL